MAFNMTPGLFGKSAELAVEDKRQKGETPVDLGYSNGVPSRFASERAGRMAGDVLLAEVTKSIDSTGSFSHVANGDGKQAYKPGQDLLARWTSQFANGPFGFGGAEDPAAEQTA
jgi:hypothetical protein